MNRNIHIFFGISIYTREHRNRDFERRTLSIEARGMQQERPIYIYIDIGPAADETDDDDGLD